MRTMSGKLERRRHGLRAVHIGGARRGIRANAVAAAVVWMNSRRVRMRGLHSRGTVDGCAAETLRGTANDIHIVCEW